MKYTVYRGTTLSEAIQLLNGKLFSKPLYRITDLSESQSYAATAKRDDEKHEHGAIIEATIDDDGQVTIITPEEFGSPSIIANLGDTYGLYQVPNGFAVLIVPPSKTTMIQSPRIVSVL